MAFNLRNRNFIKLLDFTPEEIAYMLRLDASIFSCFQVCCEPQHIRNFLRGEI